ncbi:MAG: response regulator [Planctomycetota bacterium]|nr:response regulator [Planctomycetota bacterium]
MRSVVLVAGPSLSEGLEIQGWLDDLDCQVIVAESARDVMRLARQQPIDLLIMDTALPDMEGEKFIPLIRVVRPDLPIIVTTRNHTPALEQAVRACEVVFYAIRPDDLPHLGEVAGRSLAGAEAATSSAGGR